MAAQDTAVHNTRIVVHRFKDNVCGQCIGKALPFSEFAISSRRIIAQYMPSRKSRDGRAQTSSLCIVTLLDTNATGSENEVRTFG
jgi:hypothetical protein